MSVDLAILSGMMLGCFGIGMTLGYLLLSIRKFMEQF
jgi:hypothetical protein